MRISLRINYVLPSSFNKFLFLFWWRQLAVCRSLNCASCQGGWDERSCPRSAMAMHSVAVNRNTKPSSWETDTLSLSYCRPNLFPAIFTHLLNFRNPFNFHATKKPFTVYGNLTLSVGFPGDFRVLLKHSSKNPKQFRITVWQVK